MLSEYNMLSIKKYSLSLNKPQKQIIGLLCVGTFLEYFDLMLYIHMALFLNEIFFPTNNYYNAILLSAFAFCSSYIFRPFGAIIFGFIGDKIGRKSTIVISTFIMATSCLIMANLPTYNQIGITASVVVTLCRAIQGMSSIAEFVGAQIYLTEILKPPIRYVGVMLMPISMMLGTIVALYMASKVISNNLNWRYLFWFGGIVAFVGLFARTKLTETTEFIQAKGNSLAKQIAVTDKKISTPSKIKFTTIIALFFTHSAWPVCSYFCYIYSGNILKNNFSFTSSQILHENLIISIVNLFTLLLVAYYTYRVYPLKLAKLLLIPFVITTIIGSWLLTHSYTASNLFIVRLLILLFVPYSGLITAISFNHVPILKRFTYISLALAVSHSIFYCIAPFVVAYLVEIFNFYGIIIINLPLAICFLWSIIHFENLEKLMLSNNNSRSAELLYDYNKQGLSANLNN